MATVADLAAQEYQEVGYVLFVEAGVWASRTASSSPARACRHGSGPSSATASSCPGLSHQHEAEAEARTSSSWVSPRVHWSRGVSVRNTSETSGALDFGLVVDSSIILVENAARRLEEGDTNRSVREIVRDAAVEVRKPTLFSELIIAIVYLPILALEGVEGKLFQPMALTVIGMPLSEAEKCMFINWVKNGAQ